jgi:hypothetical protein
MLNPSRTSDTGISRSALVLAAALGAAIAASPAPAAIPKTPDAKTEAVVLGADRAWADAEETGDAAFVEWLLEPGYRSVGVDGRVTEKATIVAHVRSRSGSANAAAKARRSAEVAAWKADHPERMQVQLIGDTAIVTFVSTKPGSAGLIYSCDVFVYRQGHWHGAYSQHTAA